MFVSTPTKVCTGCHTCRFNFRVVWYILQFGGYLSSKIRKINDALKTWQLPSHLTFSWTKEARQHPVLYQKVFIGFSNPFIVSITGTAWEIISQIKTKEGLLLQNLVLRWQKIKAIKMSLSCILEKNSKRERTHIFSVIFFFLHFCKQYPSRDHIKTHYGK